LTNFEFDKNLEKAWYSLYERSSYDPVDPFETRWCSLGIGYPYNIGLGHWDTPQIVNELIWFDPEQALILLDTYLKASFRQDDGMLAIWVRSSLDPRYNPDIKGAEFPCSHPPIWSIIALRVLKARWNEAYACKWVELAKRNIEWWKNNRMFQSSELYWYEDSLPIDSRRWESGYDLSPRWDYVENGPFPCIDINCQMALYFQCVSHLSYLCNDSVTAYRFKEEYLSLKSLIRENLLNKELKIFTDNNSDSRNAKKTIAMFWSLVSGVAEDEEIEYMVRLLEDKDEFCAPYGLPTVSMSESSFELDCWRGPMWMSQVFWVALGLQRYGLIKKASWLAQRSLEVVRKVLEDTGKIWEFYNPIDGDMGKLRRKGRNTGPFPDYLGHNPLLSLERIAQEESIWPL
jgi:glycogen debranching enzyme